MCYGFQLKIFVLKTNRIRCENWCGFCKNLHMRKQVFLFFGNFPERSAYRNIYFDCILVVFLV